jgi:hypothetical protein
MSEHDERTQVEALLASEVVKKTIAVAQNAETSARGFGKPQFGEITDARLTTVQPARPPRSSSDTDET